MVNNSENKRRRRGAPKKPWVLQWGMDQELQDQSSLAEKQKDKTLPLGRGIPV